MINRVLVRTRVLQTAYAHFYGGDGRLATSEAALKLSLERTYQLYLHFLRLPLALTRKLEGVFERRRRKHLATESDLHPNTRLLSNAVVAQIERSSQLEELLVGAGNLWQGEDELLRHLVAKLEKSDLYEAYLATPESYEEDRDFWVNAFQRIIFVDDMLADFLEEKSLYWDDERAYTEKVECEEHPGWDGVEEAVATARGTEGYSASRCDLGSVEIVKDFVLKSFRRLREDAPFEEVLMPAYKDPEDEKYAIHLLRQLILGEEKHLELIDKHISAGWERERLAGMDLLLIQLGVVEFLHFPNIPTQITINEYVELSKHYSTPKSSAFVNGILDSIAKELKAEGKILK